jgi:hypothetical protein
MGAEPAVGRAGRPGPELSTDSVRGPAAVAAGAAERCEGRCTADIGGVGSDCEAAEPLVPVGAPKLGMGATARIEAPPSNVKRGRTRSLR